MTLEAAGLRRRGPIRHTFATEALAAGITLFGLARVMGASAKTIDKHYGHLARDSGGRDPGATPVSSRVGQQLRLH